jgi:hypothetical protein
MIFIFIHSQEKKIKILNENVAVCCSTYDRYCNPFDIKIILLEFMRNVILIGD